MIPAERNVLGEPLQPCGTEPVTGFHRDGCCRPDVAGRSTHLICSVVTEPFLEHQVSIGNDLVTPVPAFGFPGLAPGDRWCVTAPNWRTAHEADAAAFVVLECTHERALDWVGLDVLRRYAVDVPQDPGALG